MPKKKDVTFAVGANLDGPIFVKHEVFVDDENKKQNQDFVPSSNKQLKKANTTTKKVDTKRTRGQSQKSVRMDHKK